MSMTLAPMDRAAPDFSLRIAEEFRTLAFARNHFPMLTEWGVDDFSSTIHSMGCNYLEALGRQLGCWAMTEYPVRMAGVSENRVVRPDVVWWARPGGNIVLLGEYERYEVGKETNLLEKARHLIGVFHQLGGNAKTLLLLAWTVSGADLSVLGRVRRLGYEGFPAADGAHVPGIGEGCRFVVAAAIFGRSARGYILQGIRE